MTRSRVITAACAICFLCVCFPAAADTPVKWSAPMSHYPNPWTPTTPPPAPNNPWGYQYPYAAYGFGPYGYQDQYQAQPAAGPQSGYSGNPYYQYYFGR